jgi:hypothetical protein
MVSGEWLFALKTVLLVAASLWVRAVDSFAALDNDESAAKQRRLFAEAKASVCFFRSSLICDF